ncbi:hypothetical protein TEA_013248 [Camellia sinensis var. sinensis]|uniref:TOG domain-containing protein n=1 Tax=Camellia sinensis var. sinensis TaxID=542762 RepID=A0A4S4EC63_CAMSN|nr:hypothetical protein TEA_013248 [Camellia sinensis var. sinensis]
MLFAGNIMSVSHRLNFLYIRPYILTAAQAVFQGQNEGPTKAREILDTVMNIYIKTMTEDDDKEVVAQDCMSIADIIKDIGYIVVEPYMPRLVEATLVLLREESACQQKESDGEIDDDDAEHDDVLMDAVSDLLPAFANSMGIHFAPIFEKLFGPLIKFAKASRPPQDRTMVVACLAEVAQHMGPPIAGYIDAVMPLVLKELASPVATNRRNAAFCIGELCKNGERFLYNYARYYGDALHGLYPLFGESEPDDAVRDNAAGAVARMIMVHPESIPLHQVLPVFLKVLPLKEDHEESMAVYSCVCNLVLSSNPQILSLVPDLVNLFAQVAVSPVETSEVKAHIGRAFSHLISIYGHQMQPILSSLSPTHANALAAIAPKSSRPPQDRTMVVACLAEVAQHMGPPIAGYIDAVMPLVLKELASPVATNRRNAAFCIGELCKNGERFLYNYARYYGDALHGLYPLFGESEPDDAVRDNAAGAVARMIMVHPESIPLHQVYHLVTFNSYPVLMA